MSYEIIHVMDHYEVYIKGKFVCSGDTPTEAAKEAEKALMEGRQGK